MTARDQLPVLGVLAHNYLRETGILRMREDVRVAMFAPPDSSLHRISDFSCPIQHLDVTRQELVAAIKQAINRGIPLTGMLSMRDPNVMDVARITKIYGWKGSKPKMLRPVTSKVLFRSWLRRFLPSELHTEVDYVPIPSGIREKKFCSEIKGLFERGAKAVILKPDHGSCSYYIKLIRGTKGINEAWQHFRRAHNYRGGCFIAETMVRGKEIAVETVVQNNRVLKMFITQYFPTAPGIFYEIGHFVPDTFPLAIRARINRLAQEIHNRLGLNDTITHVEMIVPESGIPAIVEFNPRMAGDLTQELHRFVHGFDFYRVAARLATGQSISDELLSTSGTHRCALIRFDRPRKGQSRVRRDVGKHLDGPNDSFAVIHPSDSPNHPRNTNDDRSAYTILAGNRLSELDEKAKRVLASAYQPGR